MTAIKNLLEIMAKLRDPEKGCPWDVEQTFKTIAPYTIEEAYEVQEAIENNDFDSLREELGDLLLQVVFHSQMASEKNLFDFDKVAETIADKLVKRHPHVFANTDQRTADQQLKEWEKQKAEEREAKAKAKGKDSSILDDVASALPAITRAYKLQKRAASVGFDWEDEFKVLDKLDEEIDELEFAMQKKLGEDKLKDEVGDILFAAVNLARHLGVDPEEALKSTNRKFVRRFNFIEKKLKSSGKQVKGTPLEELDKYWDEAKAAEAKD